MATTYSKVRFIGYVIPTTNGNMVSIGDTNGPGSVAGTYLGNADFSTDINARIAILKNAIDTAKAQLPSDEDDVINVFLSPEFFFHGTQGPYVYQPGEDDPIDAILNGLTSLLTPEDYPNWTFILGSVITTCVKDIQWIYNSDSAQVRNSIVKNLSEQYLNSFGPLKGVIFDMLINFIKVCHSYPLCEVRNRAMIISNIPLRTPQVETPTFSTMTTEKYYVSNEDYLLYDVNGNQNIVTEQMTAYPMIDLSGGDAKQAQYDEYAIFRQNNINPDNPIQTTVMDYGVEICLDHSDTRLRRNIDNEPSVIGGIHIQAIPSCGMQIDLPSVAADTNGFVFNCDGEYALDKSNGEAKSGTISDVKCIYANYLDSKSSIYGGHTQLARVTTPATGGDPNAKNSTNATLEELSADDVAIIPVDAPANLDDYYAGGPGAIHIYGLNSPYTLYP